MPMESRRVARYLWHSRDGHFWERIPVYVGAPLAGGVSHPDDGWWDDGLGNLYRNSPPEKER